MLVTILLVIALVLAAVDELRARGQSLVAWSAIIICVALLWGRVT